MIWRLRLIHAYGFGRGWLRALILLPVLVLLYLIDLTETWRNR